MKTLTFLFIYPDYFNLFETREKKPFFIGFLKN